MSVLSAPLCLAIRAYQKAVSPLLPHVCRFVPSCSEYALIALKRYGVVKGGMLAAARLAKCGPWCGGGVDEVPASWNGRNIKWKKTRYMQ